MSQNSKRTLLAILLAVGLAFLSLPAAANVLASFTDVAISGPSFINPAITAAPGVTGINTGACPLGFVNLGLDGVVVQTIQVDNTKPGAANLQLTNIQIQNLGSLPGPILNPVNGLVAYLSDGTSCISNAFAITAGTAPFTAVAVIGGGGFAIPAGKSYIRIAVQLQPANAGAYTSNINGQTIRLRTTLTYSTTTCVLCPVENGSSVVTAATTFAISLGGLETVTDLGSTPASIAPVDTNPTITETVDLTHNSQNVGVDTDIVDICVKNLGSALGTEDIQAIEVYDAFNRLLAAQPGNLLANAVVCAGAGPAGAGFFNGSGGGTGFGVSLNPGVAPLLPATWINYFIPNGGTSRFQIVVRLRNTAISGRTVRLQTTFVTAVATDAGGGAIVVGNNAQLVNPGALPAVIMGNPVTLSNGSGILRVGDASVLQPVAGSANPATTIVPISVSNFPNPGFGGFSGTLSYDPNVIQIAGGCSGITGVNVTTNVQSPSVSPVVPYQYSVACRSVNGQTGKADFSVNFVSGTPPTGGSNPVVNVAVIAAPAVAPGVSSQMSLTLSSVSDANGNPVTTSTSPGVATIRPMGDVDQDGKVEIRDAILLANAINTALSLGTSTCPFKGLLTVTQLEEADVVAPFATPAKPPVFDVCDFNTTNITSADVAAIGRLALSSASASELAQAVASQPLRIRALSVQPLAWGRTLQIRVEGNGITGLELAVYDLSGRLVASETANGNRLVFRVLAANGQPLANGVYLYTVTVRGADGQTIRTEVRKLVVLR